MRKGAVRAIIQLRSRHLTGGTEENNENFSHGIRYCNLDTNQIPDTFEQKLEAYTHEPAGL
jgi:hypothetical protein